MADNWVTTIKTWVTLTAGATADMNQEVRDRFTAVYNALHGDASADSEMAHMHKQGTLAARPAAGNAGRYYKATDLGVTFYDTGTRWDVESVNHRIAEHLFDDFGYSNIPGTVSTLNTANNLGWLLGVINTGGAAMNGAPGYSEISLITGTTINSQASLANSQAASYSMTAGGSRHPAIWYGRSQSVTTTQQVLLQGMASLAGSLTPDGIYFKRTDTATVGAWQGVCRQGGVQTVTAGSLAGNTAYHDFEILVKSLTSIEFVIDGTSLGSVTTNIPTTTLQRHYFTISNTEAVTKAFDVEAFEFIAKR